MKCKCPKCGLLHDAKEYDPAADRERERRIDYEAYKLRESCPDMTFLDAINKAREIVECEELHKS